MARKAAKHHSSRSPFPPHGAKGGARAKMFAGKSSREGAAGPKHRQAMGRGRHKGR